MDHEAVPERHSRRVNKALIWIIILSVTGMSLVNESRLSLRYGSSTLAANSWHTALALIENATEQVQGVDHAGRAAEDPSWLVKDEDSFSACLLVMDENFRLPEWIAYNYYAMPLRYLIVANDLYSQTSPANILDRWRDRITIHLWNDENFTTRDLSRPETGTEEERNAITFKNYIYRQQLFYGACLKHMKEHNRSWVAVSDVDEYLAPNADVLGPAVADAFVHRPGFVLEMIRQLQNDTFPGAADNPPFWHNHFTQASCVVLPRDRYGAFESNATDVARDVPPFLNASRFDTLRFRYRTLPRRSGTTPELVKALVDVSRLPLREIDGLANPHRPADTCGSRYIHYEALPLGFHHYIGSWENYARQNDARGRSRDQWIETAARRDGGPSDEVRPWIGGFVKLVGEREAVRLLEGTG